MISNANYTNCAYCDVRYGADVSDSHDNFDKFCYKKD